MAVKKAATSKKVATGPNKAAKGESLTCEVCGLSVVVQQVGNIAVRRTRALLCCDKPMEKKAKKAAVKAKTKAKTKA